MGIPGTNPVSGASPTGLLKRKKLQQRNDILQQRSDILLLFIEGVPKVKGLGGEPPAQKHGCAALEAALCPSAGQADSVLR